MNIHKTKILFFSCALLVGFFVFLPSFGYAATLYWVGGNGDNVGTNANDWSTTNPGACNNGGGDAGAVPGASDIATFDPDCDNNATIAANWSVDGINMQSGYAGTLTQSGSNTLTVADSNYVQAGGTFSGGSGDININGYGVFALSGGTFTSTSGNFSIGNLSFFDEQPETIFSVSSGATFTHNSGTVTFQRGQLSCERTYTIDVDTSLTLYNVNVNMGVDHSNCTNYPSVFTTASGDTIIAAGTFTHTSGYLSGTWEAQGNVVIGAAANGGLASLTFSGGNTQTFTDSGGIKPSGTVTVNKTVGTTVTLQQNTSWNVSGQDLIITSGTLSLAGKNLTVNDVLTVGASGTLQLYGAETITATTKTLSTGSTVKFTGDGDSGADTYTITSYFSGSYKNLTINSTDGATDIFNLGATLTVAGNLTITAGTLDVTAAGCSSASCAINLAGNWSNSGTFTARTGTVTLDGVDQTISGSTTFYNLTKQETTNDSTNKTLTLTSGTTTTISHTLTLSGLDSSDKLLIRASTTSAATIDFTGASTFSSTGRLDVSYNTVTDNSSGISLPLNPANSINSGNTTGWFTPPAISTLKLKNANSFSEFAAWSYRKKITISKTQVASDLTNFPLLVKLVSDASVGAHALSTGYDIRFTTSDGVLIPYERETWAVASSQATAQFWVKVPSITTAANTIIYMYYGNAAATDGSSAPAPWDSNFKAIYHLPNGSSLTTNDSTGVNNATNSGATATTGKVDGAASFDGVNDYVDAPNSINTTDAVTLEGWFNTSGVNYISRGMDGFGVGWSLNLQAVAGGNAGFSVVTTSGGQAQYSAVGTSTLSSNTWYHLVGVWNPGSNVKIYVNGSLETTTNTGTTSLRTSTVGFRIGRFHDSYGIGPLDEARISNIIRSADWIKFDYYNMGSSDNELTIDTEESNPSTSAAWLSGWSYRKKITISKTQVASDLTNFPLLVKLNADAAVGAKALSTGYDIRFTTFDGTTTMPYERETWSVASSAATAQFWVKVPSITTTANTVIYMYYGKAGASDVSSATAPWDSNFKAIYHLPDGSSLTVNDSTGAYNGTNNGATVTTGKIDGGASFDGVNDYVDAGNVGNVKTISYWVKTNNQDNGGIELNANQFIADNAIPEGLVNPTLYVDGSLVTLYGSELVANGDFETASSFTDRGSGVQSRSTDTAHRGSYSMQVVSNSDYAGAMQSLSLSGSTLYKQSGWGYLASGDPAVLSIQNNIAAGASDVADSFMAYTAAWNYGYAYGTMDGSPPNPGILTFSYVHADVAYFDDISVKQVLIRYPVANTSWHHVAITTDETVNASAVKLGKGGANYLDGKLDEVHISDSARSAAWIKFEYYNMGSANNQLTMGIQEQTTAATAKIKNANSSASWLSGWSYRKKITISKTNVASDLTNFPLLVKLNADATVGAKALSTGYDIRFTTSDGTTTMPYERETWAVASSQATAQFWVKVPTVATAANTVIYMYYGKAGASDGNDPTNVWDANFKAVYHLPDGSSLSGNDSTGVYNGSVSGAVATTGKVDGGASFDGVDDTITTGSNEGLGNTSLTLSCWVNLSSTSKRGACIKVGEADGYGLGVGNTSFDNSGNNLIGLYEVIRWINSGIPIGIGWHALALVINASGYPNLYLDGTSVFSDTVGAPLSPSSSTYIGGPAGRTLDGSADEIRISNSIRPAAWIKFEYYNMGSANNQLTMGIQEQTTASTLKRK